MIFKIQLRRLQWALRPYFKFVFVSGPFESGPGPGVLPVFEGCGPYYRWESPEGLDKALGQLKVRELLKTAMEEDGGEFVGLIGFSQGARMVTGLLADQEEGENEGMPVWKFGVLLCGSYPPFSLSASRKQIVEPEKKDKHGEIREPAVGEIIRVPSVHVRGTKDVHCEKGRRLAKFFGDKIEFEFEMGHHLPGAAGDTTSPKSATADIADAVLRQYGVEPPSRYNTPGAGTPRSDVSGSQIGA